MDELCEEDPLRRFSVIAKIVGIKDEHIFSVSYNWTIRELREETADQLSIPSDSFKVLVAGKPLIDDEKLLDKYELFEGEVKLTIMINEKIEMRNIEKKIAGRFGGGKLGTLAVLRFRKGLIDYVRRMNNSTIDHILKGLEELETKKTKDNESNIKIKDIELIE